MQYMVTRKGQAVQFESNLTLEQARDAVKKIAPGNTFASSLVSRDPDALSDLQKAWLHKLAMDSMPKEKNQPVTLASASFIHRKPAGQKLPTLAIPMAVQRFDTATAAGIKFPRMGVQIDDIGTMLVLKRLTAKSITPGAISITVRKKGNAVTPPQDRWIGTISRDGGKVQFVTYGGPIEAAVLDMLNAMALNFDGFVAAVGIKHGRCVFCCTKLSDPISMAVGYGQICAAHYGLCWEMSKDK